MLGRVGGPRTGLGRGVTRGVRKEQKCGGGNHQKLSHERERKAFLRGHRGLRAHRDNAGGRFVRQCYTVAQPAVLPACLDARKPSAGKVQHGYVDGKDEVEQRQSPSLVGGNRDVGSRREPLRADSAVAQEPDQKRRRMNQRNVQQVVEHRHAAEGREGVSKPPAHALGQRQQGNRRPERHQQEHQRRRILALIQEPEERRRCIGRRAN